jgi:thioredoxin reductase (NADPH)
VLTDEQWRRLTAYGVKQQVPAGTVLFDVGERSYDLIAVESGGIDIVRAEKSGSPPTVVAHHGPRSFGGELNLLTGQATWLSARASAAGLLHRVSPESFRRLMDEDPELSDLILRALIARRRNLREGPAARSVEILGSTLSAPALALQTYAARHQLAHSWVDFDSLAGTALARAASITAADLPVVVTPTGVLRRTTPEKLATHLGLSYRPTEGEVVDLVVVGAGPAGLGAAVYAASEGLSTLLLDAVATGGQAAASSRIENYLGFTSGISGAELTGRAAVQAQKFGVRISSPCSVTGLTLADDTLNVHIGDGADVATRSVVIATGAKYRSLAIDRWTEFEGAGIYYAATELEARGSGSDPVTVIGGANSAGQAALYLAGRGNPVTLVVRGPDLAAGMSSYLADRILAHPTVAVRTSTEVVALAGKESLEQLTVRRTTPAGDEVSDLPCRGLYCFIGAIPATDWLTGVALDERGFVLTDAQLDSSVAESVWRQLRRRPLPFETSQPRVFAVGDVRSGSMKRVAAAVGEGASAVRSVHTALGAVTS